MEKKISAIITGAGRYNGIGAQICRAFAEKGINIFFTSYDEYDSNVAGVDVSESQLILDECRSFGVKSYFKHFDLTKRSEVLALFDNAESQFGSIEILVNCLCYHKFDSLNDIEENDIDINFAVNSKSVFFLCQEFYKRFNGNGGRIINLSSTQNLEPLTTEIAYALSKSTIPTLVSSLAPIMAQKGITINAVNPGATDVGDELDRNIYLYKNLNQFGRLGKPEDAANIVLFLASEQGKWITGQTINSEGGFFRGLL